MMNAMKICKSMQIISKSDPITLSHQITPFAKKKSETKNGENRKKRNWRKDQICIDLAATENICSRFLHQCTNERTSHGAYLDPRRKMYQRTNKPDIPFNLRTPWGICQWASCGQLNG